MERITTLGLALTLLAATPALAEEAESIKSLPVNKWAKLPAKAETGYSCSQMIFAPSRGQVLHWGAAGAGKGHNDVRAFDAAAGDWTSDYPSAASDLMISGGGSGSALSWTGTGAMRPDGTPRPAAIVNGACWDSKRERLVYTMAGLMVAYDPKAKTWTDLKAKDIPAVYGVGTGYDPVNDEIVMFPHFGGYNLDRVEVDGQLSCHYGTFRYGFADNTWRRVSDTFGSEETKKARAAVLALLGKVSRASDGAWVLRKRPDAAKPEEVKKGFADASAEAAKLVLPAAAGEAFKKATERLAAAAKEAEAGKWAEAVAAAGAALWTLDEEVLAVALRVEPPPRCAAALVFDPKSKSLVMFGGKTGGADGVFARNDTWLYDCATRQWRELACKNRPPVTAWDKYADMSDLVYDPASGLFLFVLRPRLWVNTEKNVVIWGLDVAKAEWRKLHEQPWTWERAHQYNVAFDPTSKLLLLIQSPGAGQETYALRLDVAAMTPAPAPEWKAPELKPVEIPTDDPAWAAKLKELPANKWVHPKPAQEPAARDWGNLAYDPVRGWVVYFGGGHSTYQVSDVAVYSVGANRWVTTAGEHNDRVPGAGWEGEGIGFKGSARAGHQRNTYVAVDGRMYVRVVQGISNGNISPELQNRLGRNAWFCDLDRGGVWRMLKPAGTDPAGADYTTIGTWLSTPDGRVFDPGTRYDIYTNRVAVKKATNPGPKSPGESRPYCFLPDKGAKGQVFYFDSRKAWVFDLQTDTWTDLQAKNAPTPGPKPREWATPNVVEYVAGQDAVWAVIQTDWQQQAQWVYSFKHNAWAPLAMECDSKPCFQAPYGQIVYAAKHGVLVAVPHGGTTVMRPDFEKLDWGK